MSDIEEFHTLVGGLDYPMFVVTATDGEQRAGCLVGFTAQCSIDPPLFMVWLSKNNHTYTVAKGVDHLAVHVPTAGDRELAVRFGTRTGHETDKFADVTWVDGPEGTTLLADCPRWFVGRILSRHDTGDHEGMLLTPIAVRNDTDAPQLSFHQVKTLEAGNEA